MSDPNKPIQYPAVPVVETFGVRVNLRTVLADAREVVTATTAAAGVLVADGLLSGTAERWTTGVLAAASAVGVALARHTRKAKP